MHRKRGEYDKAQRAAYVAYIASPQWAARRRRSLQLAGYRCQFEDEDPVSGNKRCERRQHLEVHHRTYIRLGRELDQDLEVLCYFHHMVEHLMWYLCPKCSDPILRTYTETAAWLRSYLVGERIRGNLDLVHRSQLPRKFALVASLPEFCVECAPLV